MSNLDWGSFFRNVLGNRRPENDDTFALPSFDESDSDENDFSGRIRAQTWTSSTLVDLNPEDEFNSPDAENNAVDEEDDDNKMIYIGNLPQRISEANIIEFLRDLAEDQACEFLISDVSRPRFGHTQAYAFVKCPTIRLAQNLIQKTRDTVIMLDGRSIRIERPYPQAIRRLASRRGRSRRRSSLTRALEANNSPWQTSRRFLRIIPSGVENDDDATSNSSDNVTLDHDYYDLASFSPLPPPLFRRRSPTREDHHVDQVSISGTNRSSIYAQLRQDAERQLQILEKELSSKLSSTEATSLDATKLSKETKKKETQIQLERIRVSISKLDLEIAEVDADRNIAEESLKRFVEDHELKVQAVKDRLKDLRFERSNESPSTSANDPNANANDDIANRDPDFGVSVWARDELECICCVEKMLSPIYQCAHGHLICKNCHARLSSCPVCREQYSRPIRSRIAEALVEKISRNNGNE